MSATTKIQIHPEKKRKLPDGWRWVRLGEVCERIDYGFTSCAVSDIDYPKFLRITDIQDGKVDWPKVPGCNIPAAQEMEYALRDGDIVFARTGATTGKSFLLREPPRSIFASYLIRLRAIPQDVISDFLGAFFHSSDYWAQVSAGVRGGAQGGFNASMLKKIAVPLPHLTEQRRIAGMLREQMAAVEKARAAAQARLEAIKALLAASLRKVFPNPGDPLPSGWRWVKLEDVSKFRHGSTPSMANKSYWGGDILWVSPKDMYSDLLTESQIKISHLALEETRITEVPRGTVLIVIRSGVLAHKLPVAIAGKPLTFNQDIKAVMPFQAALDSDYLRWYLLTHESHILSHGIKQGATVHSIRSGFIEDFRIPLPPLPEQQRITEVLREQMTAVKKACTATEEELKSINALPAALLRRAFNGEI